MLICVGVCMCVCACAHAFVVTFLVHKSTAGVGCKKSMLVVVCLLVCTSIRANHKQNVFALEHTYIHTYTYTHTHTLTHTHTYTHTHTHTYIHTQSKKGDGPGKKLSKTGNDVVKLVIPFFLWTVLLLAVYLASWSNVSVCVCVCAVCVFAFVPVFAFACVFVRTHACVHGFAGSYMCSVLLIKSGYNFPKPQNIAHGKRTPTHTHTLAQCWHTCMHSPPPHTHKHTQIHTHARTRTRTRTRTHTHTDTHTYTHTCIQTKYPQHMSLPLASVTILAAFQW